MPNRKLGREMGQDDDDEEEEARQDINEQEIASDLQSTTGGLGTNFTHERKAKTK